MTPPLRRPKVSRPSPTRRFLPPRSPQTVALIPDHLTTAPSSLRKPYLHSSLTACIAATSGSYNITMATHHTAVRYVQPYRYASPNIPLSAIRRFARQIAKLFQPGKIVLFGSYAYGNPHNESDVDLLVIMPAYDVVAQAIRISGAFERLFSHSIIVRTPKQIERGLKQNNWFLREVMAKGKVLYDARNGKLGTVRRRGLAGSKRGSRTEAAAPKYGVLPLPANGGKVPKGLTTRVRPRHTKNP
jgi:uncharacterized protein